MWKCFFGFHDWGHWENWVKYYTGTFRFGEAAGKTYDFSKEGQKRTCKICGYTKIKENK